MKKIIKLNETTIKKLVAETLRNMINEVQGWALEDDDWRFVNGEDDGDKLYAVRIWPGSGYFLPAYAAFAFSEEQALECVVAFLEKNDPEMLADDAYAETVKGNIEYDGMSEEEAEEDANNSFIYVDATMEGADAPHYIFAENFRVDKFPEEKKEKILAARKPQLSESVGEDVFSEIEDKTYGLVDYLYNEGVVDYDDRHLTAYKNGEATPDYKDIAQTLLEEYPNLSEEAREMLESYAKTGEPVELEEHFLDAVRRFAEDGNCEMFAGF